MCFEVATYSSIYVISRKVTNSRFVPSCTANSGEKEIAQSHRIPFNLYFPNLKKTKMKI